MHVLELATDKAYSRVFKKHGMQSAMSADLQRLKNLEIDLENTLDQVLKDDSIGSMEDMASETVDDVATAALGASTKIQIMFSNALHRKMQNSLMQNRPKLNIYFLDKNFPMEL